MSLDKAAVAGDCAGDADRLRRQFLRQQRCRPRTYLEEQLRLKNLDNATSLAATLSQTWSRCLKDEVTIELQIAAQFDLGHYESIRLVDPSGKALVELESDAGVDGAPDVVRALVPHRGRTGPGAGAGRLATVRDADA